MTKRNLPSEPSPLSPFGYWQASVQTWADFSKRTQEILLEQINGGRRPAAKTDADADTVATELLRSFSHMNLQHWQNTARLLESYPAWMRMPHSMTGSALVDWFDGMQRQARHTEPVSEGSSAPESEVRPSMLATPDGTPDDLTRIKGIGPKMSKRLNEIGVFHFKQIADWSMDEALWVDDVLASKGRVDRDNWVSQARILSANGSATLH